MRAGPALAGLAALGLAVAVAAAACGVPPTPGAPSGSAPPASTSGHGGFLDALDCSECHTTDGWGLSANAGAGGGFDHDRTGFPLVGAHRGAACSGCHTGNPPVPQTCDGCHAEPHQRRLGDACAECHTQIAWEDTDTMLRHARSRMPLTGRHAVLDCEACHVRRTERTWSELPSDCFACHQDDYRGEIHPDHNGAAPFPRDCGRCHRTSGWTPAVIDPTTLARRLQGDAATAPDDHDRRFAISFGAHRDAPCDGCHVSAASPRRVACVGCHDDAALRRDHGRAVPRSAGACLRCHPAGGAR